MVDDRQSITIIDALQALKSKSEWHLSGDKLKWLDPNQTHPSQTDINNKIVELQAAYDAQEYARNRKEEYDALNQFELMSDDSINGTTIHKDAILAIKAKYPKPE
jgi:hypothetical protein